MPKLTVFVMMAVVLMTASRASASDTVRVFLLAGQSNMEGNNTPVRRLEELVCHANDSFVFEDATCGSTEIGLDLLEARFLNTDKHRSDYHSAQTQHPDHPAVESLGRFLDRVAQFAQPSDGTVGTDFDLTDRLYATISGYYYHDGNQRFQYGYDAFKQMSAAVGLTRIHADGVLSANLLEEHPSVTVLQFQGQLADDGRLSFRQRRGQLKPNFGARVDTYGPELVFGHYLGAVQTDDILLLKVVQGGTDLRVDWKTPSSRKNEGNELTPEELAQDSLYDALVAKAREILVPDKLAEYFPEYAGKTAQIEGFVWFQGWNDGLNPLNQSNYETNLTCLLKDLRADLELPELPVVIAQSHVGEPDNPVQVAQAEVADAFENCELIVTDDLSGYYHFDNAAHLVIGQRMGIAMQKLLGHHNRPPIANNQHFRMRAAELLALPITLAATDSDGDDLSYTILSGPSHGRLLGEGPRLEYLPESTFRGQDSFTYKVADANAESDVATVTIDVVQETYTSNLTHVSDSELYVHVPSHVVTADVSPSEHAVRITGNPLHESASLDPDVVGHPPWVSRNDLTDKTIEIDLGDTRAEAPWTLSLKLIPASGGGESSVILRSDALVISREGSTICSTFYRADGTEIAVRYDEAELRAHSSNHFAVAVGQGVCTSYLNGSPVESAIDSNGLRPLTGKVTVGPYPGKVWDIRIDRRILSQDEIYELAGFACPDNPSVSRPYPDYPNYLCGVYVCEWWPDDATETIENYRHYIVAQDAVYERNLFEGGMYPQGHLSNYINEDPGRHLELGDGIRRTFVRPWTLASPLKLHNGQHWLHENFHSFQGRLARYNGFGGNKFFLEATASWGADHNIPGVRDTLLAYYSLHPHLPLWTIQNSPVDMRAGHEFKGGHQYGAYIFWSYLTHYVSGKSLMGRIFNDRRAGSTPAQVAYELLAQQGHAMKPIFADFAARITTWDIEGGEHYAESEQASLRRMRNAKPDAEVFDAKIAVTYDGEGTGNRWTPVPEEVVPGSWAFNAFRVNVEQSAQYVVALKTDAANPEHTDFQARVVILKGQTEERTYHLLNVAEAGAAAEIGLRVEAGDELYLVVATTPDIFSGWDWYRYEYKIYPVQH